MTKMVYGPVAGSVGDPVLPRWWRTVDRWTIGCVLALSAAGLLLALASSPPLAERNGLPPFHYFYRQVIFNSLALGVMIVISMMRPELLRRMGILGFAACFAALTLLPFLGTDFGKGAVRWFSLGFVSFQPTEFLKPGFVVTCAWLMASTAGKGDARGDLLSFLVAITVAALLVKQPDFGQACLFLATWGLIYFVSGAPFLLLAGLGAVFGLGGIASYMNSDHFARRINGFLAAELDANTQLGFVDNAFRTGGFLGVGVAEGTVKWSLPDAHTDFIIAVAAEEYGFFLVICILVLFLTITVVSLGRLRRQRDLFIRLAGAGLAAVFAVQALINIGVAARVLPAKGMTLPFVSYGGSSAIATGILVGALLAFTRDVPRSNMEDILSTEDSPPEAGAHG